MAEYIDKTILTENMNICLTDLCRQYGSSDLFVCGYRAALCAAEAAPAADVEKVRHGYWQPNYETFIDYSERETEPIQTGWVCSLCGRYEPREEAYCHCGAKMDGGDDNENTGNS